MGKLKPESYLTPVQFTELRDEIAKAKDALVPVWRGLVSGANHEAFPTTHHHCLLRLEEVRKQLRLLAEEIGEVRYTEDPNG